MSSLSNTVAHRCRDSNERATRQSAQDACKCRIQAGGHDDDIGFVDVVDDALNAPQARYAAIFETFARPAEIGKSARDFACDGTVGVPAETIAAHPSGRCGIFAFHAVRLKAS